MPERIGFLLTLVQCLIGYGKQCAASLRQHAATPHVRLTWQARFGTPDLARSLIRIGRALKCAIAPGARLRQVAASGHAIQTPAECAPVQPRAFACRSTTNAVCHGAVRGAVPDNLPDDGLPSEAQCAALIRRGRAGAVIAANYRDLGLVPALVTGQPWSGLSDAIAIFGGDFPHSVCGTMLRVKACIAAAPDAREPLSFAAIRVLQDAIFLQSASA